MKPSGATSVERERCDLDNAPARLAPSGYQQGSLLPPASQVRARLALLPYLHSTANLRCYPRRMDLGPSETPVYIRSAIMPTRGRVTEFSRRSRFNMFRTFAALRLDELSRGWHASLTYHECAPQCKEDLLAHIGAWVQAIRRKFPRMQYIKRLAWQKRGVPHWHLLVFSNAGDHRFDSVRAGRWMELTWHKIAEPTSAAHALFGAKLKPLESQKQILNYLSKHTAKVHETGEEPYTGRRWSTSYGLPTRPLARYEVPDHALRKLRRICVRLARMRGVGRRWLAGAKHSHASITFLLREGELERILRIAGITPPMEVPDDSAARAPPVPDPRYVWIGPSDRLSDRW